MAAKTVKQQEETTPAATTGNDAVNNPEAGGEGQQTADPEAGGEGQQATDPEAGGEGQQTADPEAGGEGQQTADPEAEGEGQQTTDPEETLSVLIAQTYILYNSKHYKPGDVLPANDPDMLAAWIEAGTAAWVDARELEHEKVIPVTAVAGIYGSSTSSDSDNGENLVGRVPANASRSKK